VIIFAAFGAGRVRRPGRCEAAGRSDEFAGKPVLASVLAIRPAKGRVRFLSSGVEMRGVWLYGFG
jgi:hypothetical protein